ncbi:carbon storage regulator CsrA [Tepidanaerobacter sp. GT38]|uniref:carbon storage regulator CsrA n=1 Tax=Tepidanaerobacter sp. GT38 TaxID=2722793 RepID=UPI00210553CF|nr:carbon storage regulator CsrA [Tepidanaerobacter sp. GT38]MCG1011199.1 carbon storage regulator CsrA [Tepidanaerobacter sp. GT38]
MLVLTRKTGEGIVIGNDIIIKVFEIEGDRVKIGIEAPKATKVLRLELYEDISQENKKAIDVTRDAVDKLFELF